MAFHRKTLLLLSALAVIGSLSATIGYALHIRSESFRREVEADLTRFFELPCDVERIRPRTFSSRQFENVAIWLPNRRERIFHCDRAIWQEVGTGAAEAHELNIADGELVLGTDRWVREDYRQLLTSGLQHDFDRLRLRSIRMDRFGISFQRGGLALRCRETAGNIDMSNVRDGVADLIAYELNGQRVSQGVRIHARFTPGKSITVSELVLSLPPVPLKLIAGGAGAFGDVQSGRFAGTVQYSGSPRMNGEQVASPTRSEVSISGDLEDAELREMTIGLPMGPLEGRLSLKLYGARFREGALTDVRGHGQVNGLSLAPLAPLLQRPNVSGKVSLRVEAVEIVDKRLERLVVSGAVSDLMVNEWLAVLGKGSATGRLSIRINNIEFAGDQIKSADVELRLDPPKDGGGAIDRELILAAAERVLHFSWPSSMPQEILPEKLSYTECGVRLLVRDNQLRILGTHGKNSSTILTVTIFGAAFGIVQEQPGTIDLTPWLAKLREEAKAYSPQRVEEWLKLKKNNGG